MIKMIERQKIELQKALDNPLVVRDDFFFKEDSEVLLFLPWTIYNWETINLLLPLLIGIWYLMRSRKGKDEPSMEFEAFDEEDELHYLQLMQSIAGIRAVKNLFPGYRISVVNDAEVYDV